MKYMSKAAGYTWKSYETNSETAKELNKTPVLDKIQDYRRNWIQNIKLMPRKRLPRIIKTTDKKAAGTMKDHWRDFWKCETGTG
jgi:hypothetical protein